MKFKMKHFIGTLLICTATANILNAQNQWFTDGNWVAGSNATLANISAVSDGQGGAFLTFEWPVSLDSVGNNIYPDKTIINTLISVAENKCKALMDRDMLEKLSKISNYMTIGIDSKKAKISFSGTPIPEAHAELVALLDLSTNQYMWTGKSYPTTGQ